MERRDPANPRPPVNLRERHERHPHRLAEAAYRTGGYFVTICTHEKRCLLGEVCDDDGGPSVTLSPAGLIVRQEWLASASIREEARLDRYVIMPNHLHGIVMIEPSRRSLVPAATGVRPSRAPGALGSFVAGFKSAVTRRVREAGLLDGPLWQPGYHDRVIRNEIDWAAYRNYIDDNPRRWLEKRC